MAYCMVNYKTNKELKEALSRGKVLRVFSPGPFPCKDDGTEYLEGPHYPAPHTWYAQATMKDGVIVKVK